MILVLPDDIIAVIQRHAAADYPRECCGILLGRTTSGHSEICEVLPARNLADSARLHDRYLIEPRALLEADRRAHSQSLELVGFYHSHPDHPARPSATDLAAAWPVYFYVILEVTRGCAGEITVWQYPGENQTPRQIPIHSCIPDLPA